MSSRPYLKLYVASYIADTRGLSLEEHGAYLLMLLELWRRDGEFPNDPKIIAKAIGTTTAKFEKVWPSIADYFEVDDERDTISQPRLTRELDAFREKSRKSSEAGKIGGSKSKRKTVEKQPLEKADAKRTSSEREAKLESEIEGRVRGREEENNKPTSLTPSARPTVDSFIVRISEITVGPRIGEKVPLTLRECLEAEEAGDNRNPAYALPPEIRKAEVWGMVKGALVVNGLDQKAAGTVVGEMAKKHDLDVDDLAKAAVIIWRANPRAAKPYFVSVCERIAAERRN